jgi:multidrug efflux pump subunit AcrA (membrane-fusion protein)
MPDISSLAVGIDVHESLIDKVEKGMPARVKVDVFPDMKLTGKVHKIAVLAKSEWFNPDLKEYETTISIDGVHDSLKPGMSAEVEIHVATLKNVLQVPIQSVTARSGKTIVYVLDSKGNEEAREVVTGEANDRFVEIRDGLREGEVVLLEAPQLLGPEEEKEEEERGKGKADRDGPPESPGVRAPAKGGQPPARDKQTSRRGRPEGKSPRKGRPPRREKTD